MSQHKSKRKYYVPGMVSLFILPVLFYVFTQEKIKKQENYIIKIFSPDIPFIKKHNTIFTLQDYPPKRNYLQIRIDGNEKENRIKLDLAQLRIREIVRSNDSINGVHFMFTENATYGNLIAALDKLKIENAQYYLLLGNDLYFFNTHGKLLPIENQKKETKVKIITCGTGYFYTQKIAEETREREKEKRLMSNWPLLALFIVFITTTLIISKTTNIKAT